MRGSWHVKLYADPKGAAARRDLGPGRGLRARAARVRTRHRRQGASTPTRRSPSTSRPSYLYGAPAPDLADRGRRRHQATRHASPASPATPSASTTTPSSRSRQPLDIVADDRRRRQGDVRGRPARAAGRPPVRCRRDVIIRVADTNGRAVERTLTRPVAAERADDRHQAAVRRRPRRRRQRPLRGDHRRRRRQPHRPRPASRGSSSASRRNYQWYRDDGSWN